MNWRYKAMALGLLLAMLAGCQGTETAGRQETTAEADDDAKTAEDLGEVGGAGDSGSQLPDVGDFRDPGFGSGGFNR
jgi:hypothetical protein